MAKYNLLTYLLRPQLCDFKFLDTSNILKKYNLFNFEIFAKFSFIAIVMQWK